MEWQAVVLVMQILMLAVGWFLFQQARGELSARAAETPVLGEVKALHRSIKQLLVDLEQTSERASGQLETRCVEARQLISALEAGVREAVQVQEYSSAVSPHPMPVVLEAEWAEETMRTASDRLPSRLMAVAAAPEPLVPASLPTAAQEERDRRRTRVFALADAGQTPCLIARETGLSEGEVETLLGLRLQRAS